MSFHTQSDFNHQDRARRALRRSRTAGLTIWLVAAAALGLAAYTFAPLLMPKTADPDPASAAAPAFPKQAVAYQGEISGVDKDQKPFSIKAKQGLQDDATKNIIHLDAIAGQFSGSDGKALDVTSQQGQYDAKSKVLDLNGQVIIRDGKGMTATMEKAQFDTQTKDLVSQSPVNVEMPNGTVAADALTTDNNGDRLVFTGRVKARLGTEQ